MTFATEEETGSTFKLFLRVILGSPQILGTLWVGGKLVHPRPSGYVAMWLCGYVCSNVAMWLF